MLSIETSPTCRAGLSRVEAALTRKQDLDIMAASSSGEFTAAGGVHRQHVMPFGAAVWSGRVHFRLWAPKQPIVFVKLVDEGVSHSMMPTGDGWHEFVSDRAQPGDRYLFILVDGSEVPDPASRYQPEDVHGPSEIIDPSAYRWSDVGWGGREWHEFVIYELHVGAFTREGTFSAVIERLDYLHDLGITAIELMPVADFPGRRNWGYDGVLPYAPDASYGRPEELKHLVEASHARGISVILDVVYNHFGPDGNYLPLYAPIFTETHKTAWGAAVNFDADQSVNVRRFVVENAAYWIREYHLDGLRLDAVHAIKDDQPVHILEEIEAAVRRAADGRQVHLILENEGNQASLLERDGGGRPAKFTAQWNDDVHHVLHTAVTGERDGYYADYVGDAYKLGKALAEGFAFQGEVMPSTGQARGEPSADLPPTAFVSFIQNHDQVGNRAFGDRLTMIAPHEAVRAIAATYLLAPQIPMIFMGEEWATRRRFPFFCDLKEELADAVRNGRRAEFARFPEFHDPRNRELIPDPTAAETFLSAKLHWNELRGHQAAWLEWYRRCLAVRHADIVPLLPHVRCRSGHYDVIGRSAVRVMWILGDTTLWLAANLCGDALQWMEVPHGRILWSEGSVEETRLGPWSVLWVLQEGNP